MTNSKELSDSDNFLSILLFFFLLAYLASENSNRITLHNIDNLSANSTANLPVTNYIPELSVIHDGEEYYEYIPGIIDVQTTDK